METFHPATRDNSNQANTPATEPARSTIGAGSVATDSAPASTPTSPALVSQDRAELRRRKIVEYLDKQLRSSTPEVAILGGITADFAQLALNVNESLVGVLADCSVIDNYEEVSSGVELLLKLGRQIERNTRLIGELAGD